MDQETKDFLFGVAVLIPFLIFVFALGYAINRFKNRPFRTAWQPLVPSIGGKAVKMGAAFRRSPRGRRARTDWRIEYKGTGLVGLGREAAR
jgi:hypothetical protein